jgi:hypothetical protein
LREKQRNGLRNGEKSFILHISIGGHSGKTMWLVPPYNLTLKSLSSAKAVQIFTAVRFNFNIVIPCGIRNYDASIFGE